jgi:hypothetical protein
LAKDAKLIEELSTLQILSTNLTVKYKIKTIGTLLSTPIQQILIINLTS